jgi:hypothetical protein
MFFRLTKYEDTLRASLAAIGKNGEMTWQEISDFAKIWLESLTTAIGNGWARPAPTAISTQLTAFQVFYRKSTQHFRQIATEARAITQKMRAAGERGDVTQEDVDLWKSEIRALEERFRRLPPELREHVVELLLNLARTVDEGVKALHAEDMALWKQALTGVGMLLDKLGTEAAKNTAAFREVVVELPEIAKEGLHTAGDVAKKGLNTVGIALIAASVLGAAFVVPPVIRAMRKD